MTLEKRVLAALTLVSGLLACAPAMAASFKDVPESNSAYGAVEFLKSQGILGGYPDGTFRPGQKVTRAEAVKIIVASAQGAEKTAKHTSSVYTDVKSDAWFMPYVEAARTDLGMIDGPPKTTQFFPDRPVKKAEFLKLLLLAVKTDVNAFGEVKLPLSRDVTDPNAWYYPYMRYALSSSMILVNADDTLTPDQELTRGDVATFLFRLAMYKAGRRTQALLSEEESELVNVMQLLNDANLPQAEYASARALLAAKGGHASKSDNAVAQGALKIAEAFRSLVRGYRAGQEGNLDEAIRLSKEAWSIAAEAKAKSPELGPLSGQLQQISSNMAAEARKVQSQPAQ